MADPGRGNTRTPLPGTAVGLQVLDLETAHMVEQVCDTIVPGSGRVRPAVYIDALLAGMPHGARAAVIAQFASFADGDIGERVHTPEFLHVRALAIEAFYSDFVAPGVDATRLRRRRRRRGR